MDRACEVRSVNSRDLAGSTKSYGNVSTSASINKKFSNVKTQPKSTVPHKDSPRPLPPQQRKRSTLTFETPTKFALKSKQAIDGLPYKNATSLSLKGYNTLKSQKSSISSNDLFTKDFHDVKPVLGDVKSDHIKSRLSLEDMLKKELKSSDGLKKLSTDNKSSAISETKVNSTRRRQELAYQKHLAARKRSTHKQSELPHPQQPQKRNTISAKNTSAYIKETEDNIGDVWSISSITSKPPPNIKMESSEALPPSEGTVAVLEQSSDTNKITTTKVVPNLYEDPEDIISDDDLNVSGLNAKVDLKDLVPLRKPAQNKVAFAALQLTPESNVNLMKCNVLKFPKSMYIEGSINIVNLPVRPFPYKKIRFDTPQSNSEFKWKLKQAMVECYKLLINCLKENIHQSNCGDTDQFSRLLEHIEKGKKQYINTFLNMIDPLHSPDQRPEDIIYFIRQWQLDEEGFPATVLQEDVPDFNEMKSKDLDKVPNRNQRRSFESQTNIFEIEKRHEDENRKLKQELKDGLEKFNALKHELLGKDQLIYELKDEINCLSSSLLQKETKPVKENKATSSHDLFSRELAQIEQYQKELRKACRELEVTKASLREANRQLNEKERIRENLMQMLKDYETKSTHDAKLLEMQNSMNNSQKKMLERKNVNLAQLEEKNKQLKTSLSTLQSKFDELCQENESLKKEYEEQGRVLDKAYAEINIVRINNKNWKRTCSATELAVFRQFKANKYENKALEKYFDEMQSNVMTLEHEKIRYEKFLQDVYTKITNKDGGIRVLRNHLQEIKQDFDEETASISERLDEIKAVQSLLNNYMKNDAENQNDAKQNLQQELACITDKYEKMQRKFSILESANADLRIEHDNNMKLLNYNNDNIKVLKSSNITLRKNESNLKEIIRKLKNELQQCTKEKEGIRMKVQHEKFLATMIKGLVEDIVMDVEEQIEHKTQIDILVESWKVKPVDNKLRSEVKTLKHALEVKNLKLSEAYKDKHSLLDQKLKLQSELSCTKSKLCDTEKDLHLLKFELNQVKQKAKELSENDNKTLNALSNLKRQIFEVNNAKKDLQLELSSVKGQLQLVNTSLEKVNSERENTEMKLAAAAEEAAEYLRERNEIDEQLCLTNSEKERLEEEVTVTRNELICAKLEISSLEDQLTSQKTILNAINVDKSRLEDQLNLTKDILKEAGMGKSKMEENLVSLTKSLEDTFVEKSRLEELLHAMENERIHREHELLSIKTTLENVSQEKSNVEQELIATKNSLQNTKMEKATLERQLCTIEAKMAHEKSNVEQELIYTQNYLQNFKMEKAALEKQLATIQMTLGNVCEEKANIQEELISIKDTLARANTEKTELEKQLISCRNALANANAAKSHAEDKMSSIKNFLEERLATVKNTLESVSVEKCSAEQKLLAIKSDLENAQKEVSYFKEQLQLANNCLNNANAEKSTLEKDLVFIRDSFATMKLENVYLEEQLQCAIEAQKTLHHQLMSLSDEPDLREKCRTLENMNRDMKNSFKQIEGKCYEKYTREIEVLKERLEEACRHLENDRNRMKTDAVCLEKVCAEKRGLELQLKKSMKAEADLWKRLEQIRSQLEEESCMRLTFQNMLREHEELKKNQIREDLTARRTLDSTSVACNCKVLSVQRDRSTQTSLKYTCNKCIYDDLHQLNELLKQEQNKTEKQQRAIDRYRQEHEQTEELFQGRCQYIKVLESEGERFKEKLKSLSTEINEKNRNINELKVENLRLNRVLNDLRCDNKNKESLLKRKSEQNKRLSKITLERVQDIQKQLNILKSVDHMLQNTSSRY